MTTRNVFCRVLQPVPRIIDPRKICDSIEPVYLTWYFFPRFFFLLCFFLPHHGYVERFQNHWTEKSSRSERYAINQSVAITSTVSQYTISPSISPSHASTRTHCYTHTLIYSHVHMIILSHMFIRIFRHKALKHVWTTWANSYTRDPQDITQTQVDNWPIFAIGVLAYRLPPKCLDQHTQTHLRKTLTRGMSRSTNRKLLVSVFEQ